MLFIPLIQYDRLCARKVYTEAALVAIYIIIILNLTEYQPLHT